MAWVSGVHHILGVKCLGSKLFLYDQYTVSLRDSGCDWGITYKEEMKMWERNHVHDKFTKIAIKLTRERKGACCSNDCVGNELIQVGVRWVGKLECAEADVVKSFFIKSETLIGILYKLMYRKGSIVWFYNVIRNLW